MNRIFFIWINQVESSILRIKVFVKNFKFLDSMAATGIAVEEVKKTNLAYYDYSMAELFFILEA